MLLQEFLDLTGCESMTDAEFRRVHDLYMATTLSKEVFCEDWKKHGESKLVKDLAERLTVKQVLLESNEKKVAEAFKMLVRKGVEYNDVEMASLSVMMKNEMDVIRCKLKGGLTLSEKEREMILERLQ